jgi:hypothetical protein
MRYLKTDQGRAEVSARKLNLSPALRRVLILCDGERDIGSLLQIVPDSTLQPALDQLCGLGLLAQQQAPAPAAFVEQPALSEADRFHQIVALATTMAADLGFTARVKAQLQIERAQNLVDLGDVVGLLCKSLEGQGREHPQTEQKLRKLRRLAAAA